jgi:hypothetical protein
MDEREMAIALALCDLLGESVTPQAVQKAFEKAKKRLESAGQPPREPKVSYARGRE